MDANWGNRAKGECNLETLQISTVPKRVLLRAGGDKQTKLRVGHDRGSVMIELVIVFQSTENSGRIGLNVTDCRGDS